MIMKNTKKLKIVFDFIADYLSEEETTINSKEIEEVTMTEDDVVFKRAYSIMKKMDEMDEVNAAANKVKKTTNINKNFGSVLTKQLNTDELGKTFEERTGVTLDDTGKISEVKVGPLTEYVKISDIFKK